MPHDPTRPQRRTNSATRLAAFELLNAASRIAERRPAAVIDGAACLLNHCDRIEYARLLPKAATTAPVARAAFAALTERNGP